MASHVDLNVINQRASTLRMRYQKWKFSYFRNTGWIFGSTVFFSSCFVQSAHPEIPHQQNLPHRSVTQLLLNSSQLCHLCSGHFPKNGADKLWEKVHFKLRENTPAAYRRAVFTICWPCAFKYIKEVSDFLCMLIIFLCYVFSTIESNLSTLHVDWPRACI